MPNPPNIEVIVVSTQEVKNNGVVQAFGYRRKRHQDDYAPIHPYLRL